tara:strand:+ start:5212 stop:5406 length:195 start_codon:yes stop_codon:yes gene_type:complete
LFDKYNLKYFIIWPLSVIIVLGLKYYAFNNSDVLLIKNYVVVSLVFGPAFVVTIILTFKNLLKI